MEVEPFNVPVTAQESTPNPSVVEDEAYTVSEFVASVFRKEVLDSNEEEPAELGRADAVAMVDRGLRTIANGRASFNADNEGERRRWGIRLGNINLEADLAQ